MMRYLLLSLVLFAIPAHADTTYALSGTVLFTGNNTCSGVCSETVAFSFDLSYLAVPNYMGSHNTAYLAQITKLGDSWSGDIGSFSGFQTQTLVGNPETASFPGGCAIGGDNYIQVDAGGNETDVDLCDDAEPTPVVPKVSGALLFRCVVAACSTTGIPSGEDFGIGTLESTSVTTFVCLWACRGYGEYGGSVPQR